MKINKNVEILQVNRGNLLKLLSLTIILAFIMPVMTNTQAGKVNFAGTWTLRTTGQGSGGGQRMGGNLIITQDTNLLTVTRTRTGQDGKPATTTMKYTLDGKESLNTSTRGDSKSIAKWSADGDTLTIATTLRLTHDGEVYSTDAYSLTDAKTLSILITFIAQTGERKRTLVYDKK